MMERSGGDRRAAQAMCIPLPRTSIEVVGGIAVRSKGETLDFAFLLGDQTQPSFHAERLS